ncbi:hypothetical protein [Frigoribacterium sp. CG_9.8]|uniref:hypothetical protein n=1 Tax=Frigoribacterium sp. CG_9.8 TaxID=2787733 RepID=UPI0018CB00DF|nr:hypothetical protein [Frigoribacterium sp. CG_9.8]MBG6106566.1 hypothetical protein [Frigoribacterium sp. CG_9.8]
MSANKPLGSVLPDTRGRVSLTKYLPPAPGIYLVYSDPTSGVITLRPIDNHEQAAA